jgi:hypothetical protein
VGSEHESATSTFSNVMMDYGYLHVYDLSAALFGDIMADE